MAGGFNVWNELKYAGGYMNYFHFFYRILVFLFYYTLHSFTTFLHSFILSRNLWIDPDVFKPQRFLNENGELNKSLIEKVLIFGMGLRKCLGEEVARNEIFVILTTILQQLRLEKLLEEQLDITPVYGLSMTPKPYRICVSQRAWFEEEYEQEAAFFPH